MQDSFFYLTIGIIGAALGFIMRKKRGAINSATVVYAFVTGFLVSGTVPILVPLFIGG